MNYLMTADELCATLMDIADNRKTAYMLGPWGWPANEKMIARATTQGGHAQTNRQWLPQANAIKGKGFLFDCVGLIKGYGWLDASTGAIRYGTNGMPDYGANTMYRAATQAGVSGQDYGPISTMPDIVGLAVHMNGHIGVYIGNGCVIEAANTSTGVIKTQLAGRGWSSWCKIPYIDYLE